MSKDLEYKYFVRPEEMPDVSQVPYVDIVENHLTPLSPNPHYPEVHCARWVVRQEYSGSGEVQHTTTVSLQNVSDNTIDITANVDSESFGLVSNDHVYGVAKKRRYIVGDDLFVDVINHGEHQGLAVAEKKFRSKEEQAGWQRPDWCQGSDRIPESTVELLKERRGTVVDGLNQIIDMSDVDKLIGHIVDRVTPQVVTVSGFSGSGKSTLSRLLSTELQAALIETDHLHIGKTKLLQRFGVVNHDLPGSYDYAQAGELALRLNLGESVDMPVYSFETAEPTGYRKRIIATPNRNVVIDGLYASRASRLQEMATSYEPKRIDLLVDTPLYVSVIRRLIRDSGLGADQGAATRRVQFTPEETLAYVASVALPSYLRNVDRTAFDYIVRK